MDHQDHISATCSFYKAEVSNIMDEVLRIIDRLNEFATDAKRDSQLEWPAYCEVFKMPGERLAAPDQSS